jgi:hypothetical protein
VGLPERVSPRSSIPFLHPGGVGADDHPFLSALDENIHPTPLAARVLPSVGSLFGDTALHHGNIVQHLHVHRSNFKGLEFMVAGFFRSLKKPFLVKILALEALRSRRLVLDRDARRLQQLHQAVTLGSTFAETNPSG